MKRGFIRTPHVSHGMATRKRRYCLTLNNPTEDEIEAVKVLESNNLKRAVFAHEVGDSGTPHLQGFIHMKNAMTYSAVKKMLSSNRYHIESAKGTDYEAWTYCLKDGDVIVRIGDEPTIAGS